MRAVRQLMYHEKEREREKRTMVTMRTNLCLLLDREKHALICYLFFHILQSIYCPAKSPKGPVAAFPLRSALVFFVTSFGFYVCYFSSRQSQIIALETTASGGGAEPTTETAHCSSRPAIVPHGPQTRYLHFPRPATYDR